MNDTTPHDHDALRELLALRLYDELDPAETTRLDAHLAECSACRAYDAELVAGLGSLRPVREDAALPADWRARLERSVEAAPRPAHRPHPAWTFAAGLAAGLLAMALLRAEGGGDPIDPGSGTSPTGTAQATNLGPTAHPLLTGSLREPPPRATGGGQLAYLGSALRDR